LNVHRHTRFTHLLRGKYKWAAAAAVDVAIIKLRRRLSSQRGPLLKKKLEG
jgi:hypothetical protein